MKEIAKALVVIIAVAIVPLNLARAQSRSRDRRIITFARNLDVSKLDRRLPKRSFERWLRSVVGKRALIKWEVDDCGEQDGNPSNPINRNPPLCATAHAKMRYGGELGVAIVVGSHKSGMSGRPGVFYTYLKDNHGASRNPQNLGELAAAVRQYRRVNG